MIPVSLRARTLLAVLLLLAVLVGILLVLAESIIGSSFREAEARTVTERVEQVSNALNNSIADIERITRDYANWDDSYAFMSAPDDQYIADNMIDSTFINNSLSYVGYVNTAGELLYERAFDLATGQEMPVPPELRRFDGPNARLLQSTDPAGHIEGLIVLAQGPMLIAAQAILTSKGEGPPAGTLLMGRLLDAHEIARLSRVTRLPITVSRIDDAALSPELRQAFGSMSGGVPIATVPRNNDQIIGATQVASLLGQPSVLLSIELPRDIYQLGQQTTRDYVLVLIGAGVAFGATVLIILDRSVLARTTALSEQISMIEINQSGAQVTVGGRDEVGQLGNAINHMLGRLERARQQIAESEQRYRHLLELSPDAIIVHDQRHISYINAAGARLLGNGEPAGMLGSPVDATIRSITPREDGSPALMDRLLALPDGTEIEAELIALAIPDRDAPAVQVIVRNISARKEVEKALRAAKEAADAANLAKSQFLATMSHELRTPLTAIIGYAELLDYTLSESGNEDALEDLSRIRTAGKHLLSIINDVLDLSKIEAGRMHVRPWPVNIESLFQVVATTVQPIAAKNGNRLMLHGAEAARSMLTDENHLRQILINLVGNACKFTHDGDVTVEVSDQPGEDTVRGEEVIFVVRDTGIGIGPDQIARLFQDFMQADSSSTRKYGGTGLGLSLSQRLATLLGGRITVSSELGKGSTFTLTLPRNLHVDDVLDVLALAQTPTPARANPTPAPLENDFAPTQIVLVIDDDPAVRDLVPRLLAGQRELLVETAMSGEEGIELAQALLPDLIILDVLLPKLSGWAVLNRLKEDPSTQHIPVLMMTIDQDSQQGFILGAAGYLRKPVDIQRIVKEIDAILTRSGGSRHVLLVEDDVDLRGYLRRTLEADGWSVAEAADALTALALLDQQRPALAVVDLMLPGIDGIELIATIRARPLMRDMPILVVTAKDLSRQEEEQLKRSVELVLRKGSFHGEDLLRSAWALVGAHDGPLPYSTEQDN